MSLLKAKSEPEMKEKKRGKIYAHTRRKPKTPRLHQGPRAKGRKGPRKRKACKFFSQPRIQKNKRKKIHSKYQGNVSLFIFKFLLLILPSVSRAVFFPFELQCVY